MWRWSIPGRGSGCGLHLPGEGFHASWAMLRRVLRLRWEPSCVGMPVLACRRVLHPQGRYIMVGVAGGRWTGPFPRAIRALLLSWFVSQTLLMFLEKMRQK